MSRWSGFMRDIVVAALGNGRRKDENHKVKRLAGTGPLRCYTEVVDRNHRRKTQRRRLTLIRAIHHNAAMKQVGPPRPVTILGRVARIFRFRLATLLVVTAVFACWLAW